MAMTLRTDEELDRALTELAEAEGISKQEVIRRAVLERHARGGRQARLEAEIRGYFPQAATSHEASVSYMTRELMRLGEPVMHLSQLGARTGEMFEAAVRSLGAAVEVIDAAPEHTELEVLGGLLPLFGARPAGSPRLAFKRGKLTQHLVTGQELKRLKSSSRSPSPIVVWIRDIDQWSEDLRTALNGLLEDGYIELQRAEWAEGADYPTKSHHFFSGVPYHHVVGKAYDAARLGREFVEELPAEKVV
jgi:predicted transcriptional regulator